MWNGTGAGCCYQALQSQAQGTDINAILAGLLEWIWGRGISPLFRNIILFNLIPIDDFHGL